MAMLDVDELGPLFCGERVSTAKALSMRPSSMITTVQHHADLHCIVVCNPYIQSTIYQRAGACLIKAKVMYGVRMSASAPGNSKMHRKSKDNRICKLSSHQRSYDS